MPTTISASWVDGHEARRESSQPSASRVGEPARRRGGLASRATPLRVGFAKRRRAAKRAKSRFLRGAWLGCGRPLSRSQNAERLWSTA
jgi:hypothetical protein